MNANTSTPVASTTLATINDSKIIKMTNKQRLTVVLGFITFIIVVFNVNLYNARASSSLPLNHVTNETVTNETMRDIDAYNDNPLLLPVPYFDYCYKLCSRNNSEISQKCFFNCPHNARQDYENFIIIIIIEIYSVLALIWNLFMTVFFYFLIFTHYIILPFVKLGVSIANLLFSFIMIIPSIVLVLNIYFFVWCFHVFSVYEGVKFFQFKKALICHSHESHDPKDIEERMQKEGRSDYEVQHIMTIFEKSTCICCISQKYLSLISSLLRWINVKIVTLQLHLQKSTNEESNPSIDIDKQESSSIPDNIDNYDNEEMLNDDNENDNNSTNFEPCGYCATGRCIT